MKKPPASRFTRAEKSWILYDWANSVYATNIMAAIFPIVYANMADDVGDKWYGIAVSAASLIIALLAPILGSVGDFPRMKKKLFTACLLFGLFFTGLMAFAGTWQLMLVGYVISHIGYSGANLFYDSFLTDVTTRERMDRVSSWGYAMGYIGGSTIPFLASIAVLLLTDYSTFGIRFSILIVPVWWALFSIPMLRNVRQVYSVPRESGSVVRAAFANLFGTARAILSERGLLLFMLSYFFYIDGVNTVISVSTNYGSTLGLGSTGMVLALVVTQVVAVPFSILFSRLSDRLGALRLIVGAIGVYVAICCVGFLMGQMVEPFQTDYARLVRSAAEPYAESFSADDDRAAWEDLVAGLVSDGRQSLSAESVEARQHIFRAEDGSGLFDMAAGRILSPEDLRSGGYRFSSPEAAARARTALDALWADISPELLKSEAIDGYTDAAKTASTLFWVLAFLVGTVQGGIQALSRSYFGRLIPPERSNEYFGFFDVFGKFAAVVGPLLYSLFFMLTDRASVGILSLILLFLVGAGLLIFGGRRIREIEQNIG
ncbi:MAG: MFS transporter [Clostridia bacterium]|nr:MFS transporter [Clostridia bacterium]